jgi:hypothetical protein
MGLYPYADRYTVERSLPQSGRSRHEIVDEIKAMSAIEDAAADDGKISGSFYSGDHQHYANTAPGVMDRFAEDLHGAVAYARERVGAPPKSGAAYGAGGTSVPRDMVQAGMSGWLDATQSLPPLR